jgi:DNA polymerase-1
MTDVIVDIETDALDATVIHVACTRVVDTDERRTFIGDGLDHLPGYLSGYDRVIGHNALSFDIPIINRLLGGPDIPDEVVMDTLLLSQLLWPDRPGGHSLKAWGLRLKNSKIEFDDWSVPGPEMTAYCRQDVDLTHDVLTRIRQEAYAMDKPNKGTGWSRAILTEHRVRSVMNRVEEAGYLLDVPRAAGLVAHLSIEVAEIEADVLSGAPDLPKARRRVIPKLKKDGTLSSVGLRHLDDISTCGGEHTVIEWVPFNLSSRQQIAQRLIREGWKPRRRTEHGQPIVDETTLSSLDIPLAKKIARYLLLQKRVTQINSWIEKVHPDGRVRSGYRTLGAITHRMSCVTPNLQQVPGPQSEYGPECRECWTVAPGRTLIGTDLAGIELRCLAHYLDDKDYTEELINGDVHTRTQRLAGLPTRAGAKTFTYALLYGAGDAKLGTIVGGGAAEGRAIRQRYLRGMPSFDHLQRRITRESGSGHIRGIDDRMLRVRSEHAALNTLLQSCAAVVAKLWLVRVHEHLPAGAFIVAMIHDELCIETDSSVSPEHIGQISKDAIQHVAGVLDFNCPLDCDWTVGNNWSETH